MSAMTSSVSLSDSLMTHEAVGSAITQQDNRPTAAGPTVALIVRRD